MATREQLKIQKLGKVYEWLRRSGDLYALADLPEGKTYARKAAEIATQSAATAAASGYPHKSSVTAENILVLWAWMRELPVQIFLALVPDRRSEEDVLAARRRLKPMPY